MARPTKKGDGCHALSGCQNSKYRRHLHAHFGSGRGHLLWKLCIIIICLYVLWTHKRKQCIPGPYVCMYTCAICTCMCWHIVDTHTFRFCTAKFHTHQFTKVILEQFHNIVTNMANSYRLPPGPTERERGREGGRYHEIPRAKEGRKEGRKERRERKQHINAMTLAVLQQTWMN